MISKGKKVIVYDDNVEKALRKFKKKINDDGLLQELVNRQFYIKPTLKKKLARNQAKKRWQKYIDGQKLPPKLF